MNLLEGCKKSAEFGKNLGKKLRIGWFYPDFLNLYGDSGNIEILVSRSSLRGIPVEIEKIDLDTFIDPALMESLNLVFMGGGPDLNQQHIYKDLLEKKGSSLTEYLDYGGVGLFICGSYQLLGSYYKGAAGEIMEGLKFLDFFTEHPGVDEPRMVGNVVSEASPVLLEDPVFKRVSEILPEEEKETGKSLHTLVGFENHGGRTYLDEEVSPLGYTVSEGGNNQSDKTEGVVHKNMVGTYLHGPILARNPHLADYLISKALKIPELPRLNDEVIISAHLESKKLIR